MGTQVMQHREWTETFRQVFGNAVERYQAGERDPEQMVLPAEANFLASIGSTPHELFGYVEDWCEVGEPPFETVLAIAAICYEYFVSVQHGARSPRLLSADSFTSGADCLGGFRWLPRIIAKARAKLHGELPPELMYGCGADRPFLKKVGIEPAEFLRLVWEAGDDDQRILSVVEQSAEAAVPR